MFNKDIYIKRRALLQQKVSSGIILLLGNGESRMNYKDNWYHFRQDSSFLYFTGLDKPNLAVIIDIDNNTEILFGDDLTVMKLSGTDVRKQFWNRLHDVASLLFNLCKPLKQPLKTFPEVERFTSYHPTDLNIYCS